jgi:hypothetical protein
LATTPSMAIATMLAVESGFWQQTYVDLIDPGAL